MDGDEVSYQPRARSVSSRPKHLKQIGVDPDFRLQRYTPKNRSSYKIWTPNPHQVNFWGYHFLWFFKEWNHPFASAQLCWWFVCICIFIFLFSETFNMFFFNPISAHRLFIHFAAWSATPATQNPSTEARSPKDAWSATPATQNPSTEAREPKGRQGAQGVHQTPWRAWSATPATQNPSTEARSPRDARGRQGVHQTPCKAWSATPPTQNPSTEARSPTSRPLESLKCYACHAKSKHRGPGAQGTPGDNQGRTSCPLESLKCRACHAKCKHRGPEPKGRQGTPGRTSDPLESLKLPRLPRKMQARRKPGAQGTPGGRQGVHQTPWRAWSAGPAHERKMQAQRPGAQGTPGGTPGRTSCPLESLKCRACHAKCKHGSPEPKGRQGGDARAYNQDPLGEPEVPAPATQNASTEARSPRDARGRQGVHHAPWRAWSAAPATQNASTEARSQGTPGRTSDPLESLKVPRLPRKSLKCRACHAKCKHRARSPRDARGTPGRTSDPLVSLSAAPATQNASTEARRQSQGTPGRTSCPLESLKCRACHAKCKHRARSPRDARGRQGVHQTPWRAWSAAPATQSECVRCECVRGKCVRGLVLEVKCVRGKCVRGKCVRG